MLAAAERGASGAVPELTALQEQAGQGRACGPIVWAGAGWSWVELESAAFCCLTAEHTDETKSDAPRAHLAYERGWLAVIRLKEGLRADAGAVGLCDSGRAGAGCVHTLALVRDSMRIVHQNLLSAAGYNAVCVPLALLGHMSPWLAGRAGRAGRAGYGGGQLLLLVLLIALRLAGKVPVQYVDDAGATPVRA